MPDHWLLVKERERIARALEAAADEMLDDCSSDLCRGYKLAMNDAALIARASTSRKETA